jgi:hypothetical protein
MSVTGWVEGTANSRPFVWNAARGLVPIDPNASFFTAAINTAGGALVRQSSSTQVWLYYPPQPPIVALPDSLTPSGTQAALVPRFTSAGKGPFAIHVIWGDGSTAFDTSVVYADTTHAVHHTYSSQVHHPRIIVRVTDAAGRRGADTTHLRDWDTPPPIADLSGSATSSTQIHLVWTSQGGVSYDLQRSQRSGGYWGAWSADLPLSPPQAAGTAEQTTDAGLTSGKTYQYRLRACSTACSTWAKTAPITTP